MVVHAGRQHDEDGAPVPAIATESRHMGWIIVRRRGDDMTCGRSDFIRVLPCRRRG